MPETEYNRLFYSAKDRAAAGFQALVQRAIQDADREVGESLARARSGVDQSTLKAVRHYLRQDGNIFLRRIDVLFRGYLDRAMQTMYVDLRQDMRKLSIDELSLIDDEVVNHQIEVGRLTERMRDASREGIGRLNVIVAKLHGKSDVRERENPFRPYLLARALNEAIRETAADQGRVKVLFEHLANAFIHHLPNYYESIREVFETSGVRGEFQAQRSRAAHNQRYFGAPPGELPAGSAHVIPGLQRLLDALQSQAGDQGQAVSAPADTAQTTSVHDMVRKMLAPSRRVGPSGNASSKHAKASPLVAQLTLHQRAAAGGTSAENLPRLLAMREQLSLDGAPMNERLTVDVVAMLFEFILEDEVIPADVRQCIARLQIPFLKAAVLEPEMLQDDCHPARRLLNRLSSAFVGVDPGGAGGRQLAAEADRIVRKVLSEFETDTAIFASSLLEFESFLKQHLQQDDGSIERGIEAIETAERFSVLLSNTTNALCEVLLPLNVDKRVSDLIIHVWPHVLVHAAVQDAERRLQAEHPDSLYRQYHAVLPALVWSIQEKKDAQERTTLIRLLPELAKRLRAALQMIQLPEDEATQILDQLVELHTGILRAVPGGDAKITQSLDDLRQQFSRLVVRWERAAWTLDEPPQPRTAVIEEMLAKRGVAAELKLGAGSPTASAADREFLAQTYLLGTRIEIRGEGRDAAPAQLVWVSSHRSLYLFKQEGDGRYVLYTFASLLEALRTESIVPLEYAPVFERAVEALLFDAANMPVKT